MMLDIDCDLSVELDTHRTLWLTEISQATFEEQGLEYLESDSGLFVVLENTLTGAFDILAKAASPTSGADLLDLVAAMLPKNPSLPQGA